MNDFDLQEAVARVISRVRQIAEEEGIKIEDLNRRSPDQDPNMRLTIWVYTQPESDKRIEMLISRQDLRFYESEPEVQRRVDERIRSYFGE